MATAFAYRYPAASRLESRADGMGCQLVGDQSGLFRGRAQQPQLIARCLQTVSQTVMSQFALAPSALHIILDPIATVGRDAIRFEGFSSCCSVYARADFDRTAFDEVVEQRPGTTNVDFRTEMRSALARVRNGTKLWLEVGREAVAIDVDEEVQVERKVPLPKRWLKGLGESQALLASLEPWVELDSRTLRQFLRSLPRSATRESHVARVGDQLRLTQRQSSDSIPLYGLERLQLLDRLSEHAETLTVYADSSGASAWLLQLRGGSLTLLLSPDRWRGFTGEGRLLESLASSKDSEDQASVLAALRWGESAETAAIAARTKCSHETVQQQLMLLAARGEVGFELGTQRWFHRAIPFPHEDAERLHPRLLAARKLTQNGAVTAAPSEDNARRFIVKTGEVAHVVVLDASSAKCSCPWFAKHQDLRGPCRHILAATLHEQSHEPGG